MAQINIGDSYDFVSTSQKPSVSFLLLISRMIIIIHSMNHKKYTELIDKKSFFS